MPPVTRICEAIEVAHARIQTDFADINPVVAINKQMRTYGIPSDVMTIDCMKSGKRILLVFHDSQPDLANYQFCRHDADPGDEFESIPLQSLTDQQLYDWMKDNFSMPH